MLCYKFISTIGIIIIIIITVLTCNLVLITSNGLVATAAKPPASLTKEIYDKCKMYLYTQVDITYPPATNPVKGSVGIFDIPSYYKAISTNDGCTFFFLHHIRSFDQC